MRDRKVSFLFRIAGLALSISLAAVIAQAQNVKPAEDNNTLQTLLNEVRLLRQTMQQTGLNTYRSHIILELMRTRNEQVVRLTRAVEESRDDVEKIEATIPRMAEQSKLLESMVEQELDATKRTQLTYEAKERKRDVERYKTLLERARDREQQLSNQLRAEQAKLAELESRLSALEREIEMELDRQRREEPVSEGKKRGNG